MRGARSQIELFERQHRRSVPQLIEPGADIAKALRKAHGWQERERIAFTTHQRVHETYRERNRGDKEWAAYETAIADFRAAMENVYPPKFLASFEALWERRQPVDLSPLIAFLEADPYFFGSGYMKETVIRLLKRCDLTPTQAERLRGVVLHVIKRPVWRREFRHYGRLARKVASPAFRAALENLAEKGNERERPRASWILDALNS